MAIAAGISSRVIDAVLGQRLAPDARLGEKDLAALFGCSRTVVREAMIDLAGRGIVTVSLRRGWYLTAVTDDFARELYDARLIIETGLLRQFGSRGRRLEGAGIAGLRAHLDTQRAAVEGADVGRRSHLLGDFHVRLAQCLGNGVLAGTLRDLTVLTTLYTMRHQSPGDARRSYEEHVGVVEALAAGDVREAEARMARHLGTWELKTTHARGPDPLEGLRRALAPPAGPPRDHATTP